MGIFKIVAMVLIIAGVLGLVYGNFSFNETHKSQLGPVEVSVKENQTVNVPVWVGVGAIAAGSMLLLLGARKN